jgi:hypothetical protein
VTPEFDDLVGRDLDPEERARLLKAHELLIEAGPPPELPESLQGPRRPQAEIVPFFSRRRTASVAVLAAALAAALFGVGFLVGDRTNGEGFAVTKTIVMRPTPAAPPGAIVAIGLGERDAAGNLPMLVRAANLKNLPSGAYYTLWLTRDGRAIAPCGSFVTGDAATTQARFTVYYQLKRFDGWVLTYQPRGEHEPGEVLLRSV